MSSDSDKREHPGFICGFCDEHIPTSDDMRTHLWTCGSKTDLCPTCNTYIIREILAYHIGHNCTNPNLVDQDVETNRKFTDLFDKATDVQKVLNKDYYETEVNHVAKILQFNIIIIGSPRVGKSQLINALCNGEKLARTSMSLNSCTKEVTEYVLNDDRPQIPAEKRFQIKFYDTPGIESWNNNEGETTMIKFIEENHPVCVIYCASPGSFAKMNQLNTVLEYCKAKEIFCALVCTNMWSGNSRNAVIDDFEKNLFLFGEKIDEFSNQAHTPVPHKVTFFGKGALCTMVNSIEYYDPDFSDQRKPVQGIDELIHGIMEALDHEKLLGWCYAVLHRRSYWEKIAHKGTGFFSLRRTNFYNCTNSSPDETASNIFTYLYELVFNKRI